MPRQRQAVLLGVGAIAVLAIGVLSLPPRPPSVAPATLVTIQPAMWPNAYVVRPGDQAVGIGQLVARPDEPTRLCTGLDGVLGSSSAQYRCSPLSIAVRDVDVRALAGFRVFKGATYVNAVVRGKWDGTALSVDGIGGEAPSLPASTPLSCEFWVPGGVDSDPGSPDDEAAYRRLQSIVDGDTAAYAGSWLSTEGKRAVVVATTNDLVSTGNLLRRQFPFELCLVHVAFSMQVLSALADNLPTPAGQFWLADIDVQRNRVLVRVPTLDSTAVAAVSGQPAAELVPLLLRAN